MNAFIYFLTGVLLFISLSVCAAPTLNNQGWNGVLVNAPLLDQGQEVKA